MKFRVVMELDVGCEDDEDLGPEPKAAQVREAAERWAEDGMPGAEIPSTRGWVRSAAVLSVAKLRKG